MLTNNICETFIATNQILQNAYLQIIDIIQYMYNAHISTMSQNVKNKTIILVITKDNSLS